MPPTAWLPLLLFMVLLLDLSLMGLAASGHFPRTPDSRERIPPIDLYGSMAVGLLALLVGLAAAYKSIPWYAAVIGGGVSVLAAPLLLQKFSDKFVDGRIALMVFSAIAVVITLGFFFLSAGIASK